MGLTLNVGMIVQACISASKR